MTARNTSAKPKPKSKTPARPRKSRKKPGAVMGRPSIYSEELAARLCSELASGKSLRAVCKADDMPAVTTVFLWLQSKSDFLKQYEKAKAESADFLVEEMLDIADDGRNDWMETFDNEGNSAGWKLNGEHVQRSRLRVDVRKWAASKLKPKKYGEKVDVEHGVTDTLGALIQSVQGNSLVPVQHEQLTISNKDENDD